MTQMTLRQIPDSVEKKLRARSQQSGRSINRTAIELLEESLGVKAAKGKKRDLSLLSGKWQEEEYRAFQKNTARFDQIEPEIWNA